MSANEERWHTVTRDDLIWRELDGDLVVCNARTGSTHLLEPLAAEVLRALAGSNTPITVPTLVSRLCDGGASAEEWTVAIEAVVSEFERLGLAERSRG